jgi:hypothetical protein
MEIVLLWLDDLDDLLFCAALVWERLRRQLLQVGLAASFALAATDVGAIATQFAPFLVTIAATTVGAWLLGAAARTYYRARVPVPAA